MRYLVTGASGQLGAYLLSELVDRGADVIAWSGSNSGTRCGIDLEPVDLEGMDPKRALERAAPDVVIHGAAISRVDVCFREPDRAMRVNSEATAGLAKWCSTKRVPFVYVSTDMVFDGERAPYREDAATAPLSVYGNTKAAGESAVVEAGGIVARVSLLFGATRCGRPSFFDTQLDAFRSGREIRLFTDEWRTPISYRDAARALIALSETKHRGIVHVGGPERMSRLEMGQRIADCLALRDVKIVATPRAETPTDESRPADLSLDSTLYRQICPDETSANFEDAVRANVG